MNALIYYLAFPFLFIISRLPFPILYLFSDGICFLVYRVIGYRKSVVHSNIKLAFPALERKELLQIDIDEKTYSVANMQLVAKDRMREIKLWSVLKKEFNDGSFDDKDVNRHQLDSYALIMKNKAETLTSGSSQPEVFNVLGQLQTIERVKKSGEMIYNKKEQLTNDLGAKEK